MPGIFAAGDVTSVKSKQIIIAAGDGAKAALEAFDYLMTSGRNRQGSTFFCSGFFPGFLRVLENFCKKNLWNGKILNGFLSGQYFQKFFRKFFPGREFFRKIFGRVS